MFGKLAKFADDAFTEFAQATSGEVGGGRSRRTETRTTTGPDGITRTQTRTYESSGGQGGGGGGGGFGFGFMDGGINAGLPGLGSVTFGGKGSNFIKFHRSIPNQRRYSKGWGSRREHRQPPGPPMVLHGKTYEEIKAQCLQEGRLFEDPDFPAVDSSIFYSRRPPRPFVWKRPPELCGNPQLFVEGASRFDVKQGELGDCWLLAAVASLCQNKTLLYRVVPPEQSFTDGYAGIFHFQFWQYGDWVDVIIDDRLPTYYDKLVFMHSEDMNEFWTPLLEKAYAKLCGSYEALKGGATSEAMEDFTGGVTEMFDFRENVPNNLFQIMLKADERGSLMGCSIEAKPGELEAELPNGLIMGHAYSITAVRLVEIETSRMKGKIPMIRIRNPWGNEAEWNGAWSDKSQEWNYISPEERENIGLVFQNDGEFWMSFNDFKSNYQKLEICNLGPDSPIDEQSSKKRWESNALEGSWRSRVNAGGCRNYLETFWTNPQYRVEVVDPDEGDEENMGTVLCALMQKERRKLRKEGMDLLTMGYVIYKVPEQLKDPSAGPLDMRFFKYNASVAKSPAFINLREVCGRHKLPPGTYCIIPSTFEPNMEGDFLLRIFSEKPNISDEIDEETSISDIQPEPELSEKDKEHDARLQKAFMTIAGEDMEIDAYELKEILDAAFMGEFQFDGFSNETCRSMLAMMDLDRSGKLGFDEFRRLWNDLRLWKNVFRQFDKDGSGKFSSFELRQASHAMGFRISNSTFNALVQRYSHRDGKIQFDDFIHCTSRLKTMFDVFKETQDKESGKATFGLDEFIQTTMYS